MQHPPPGPLAYSRKDGYYMKQAQQPWLWTWACRHSVQNSPGIKPHESDPVFTEAKGSSLQTSDWLHGSQQKQDLLHQSLLFYLAIRANPWNSWRGISPPCMHFTTITVNISYTCISMEEKSQLWGITGSKKRNPVEMLGIAKDPTPKSVSLFNQQASAHWAVMQEAL